MVWLIFTWSHDRVTLSGTHCAGGLVDAPVCYKHSDRKENDLLNLTKQRCQYEGYVFKSKHGRHYYFTNSLSELANRPALNRFITILVINIIVLHINRWVTVSIWVDFLLHYIKYRSIYECRRKIDVKYPYFPLTCHDVVECWRWLPSFKRNVTKQWEW